MVDATRNIDIIVKDQGTEQSQARIVALGKSADVTNKSLARLADSFKRLAASMSGVRFGAFNTAFSQMSSGANQSAPAISHLAEQVKQLNANLNSSRLRSFSSSARDMSRELSSASSSAATTGASFGVLSGVLRTVLAYLGVRQIAAYADAWANLSGQISVVTDDENQLVAVRDRLFQVSQNVRQSVTEVTGLYGRMAIGAKDLGMSQNELIQITENVSKTLSYSHVSAERASGALMQLSKSFSTPKVMARDFNSVLHQIPALVQQIANHVDGAGGSINKLRQMMLNKTLTNSDWAKGILGATDDINKMFGKAAPLISQGFAVIANDAKKLFGTMNEGLNIGGRLVELGQWAGDHLPEISAGLLSIGAAAAVAFAPRVITAFTTALRAMTIAAMANPFIAMAAAITGVTVAVYAMRDSIKLGRDGVVSLGDIFSSMSEASGGFVQNVANSVNNGLGFLSNLFSDTQKDYDKTLNHSSDVTSEFYDGVGNGMSDFFIAMAKGFDYLTTLIGVLGVQIVSTGALITKTIGDAWNFLDRHKIVAGVAEVGAGAAAVYGSGGAAAGLGGGALMTKGVMNIGDGFKDMVNGTTPKENQSKSYSEIFKEGNDQIQSILNNKHSAEDMVKVALTNAHHNALVRKTGEIEGELDATAGMDGRGKPTEVEGKKKKQRDYSEAIANGLDGLLKSIFPSLETEIAKAKDNHILGVAEKRGLISPQKADILKTGMTQKYLFSNTPNDLDVEKRHAWDLEFRQMQKDVKGRQVLGQVIQEEERLRKEGVADWRGHRDTLTRYYQELTRSRDILAEKDAIDTKYNQSRYKTENTLVGIHQAQNENMISGQTAKSMRVSALADYTTNQLEAGKGNSSDMVTSAVNKAREGFTNVRAGASSAMGGFFSSFSDGFANSIGAATTGMQNFGQAIRNVAQGAMQSLISSLVKLGIQWAITSAMSKSMAASSTASVAPIIAQGEALNEAYEPAAVNVSLATFGANGVGATTAIMMAQAAASAGSLLGGKGKGFKSGGYTGDGGTSDVAGVVHGKEYVFNAEATARLGRDTLDAMSNGAVPTKLVSSTKNSIGGGDTHVHIPAVTIVNPQIQKGGSLDEKTQKKFAASINDQVEIAVNKSIIKQQRAGGQLASTTSR